MRILVAHNYYLQGGGEDTAFRAERALLRSRGHQVIEYIDDNTRIARASRLSVAAQTIWSWSSYQRIMDLIHSGRPEIAHFHNIFPLISPAAYYACRRAGVPVIQTLYNPRLICPAASLYRNGGLCTDCLGRMPWPGVVHGCYHQSRSQTLVVASMLVAHRFLGTWNAVVGRYLVATEFYRDLCVRGGLPKEKLVIKPNFIASDPGLQPPEKMGEHALFVARLDPEKGVRTMLKAWVNLKIPLIIRGEGQLEKETLQFIRDRKLDHIKVIGRLSNDELVRLVKGARFLVWPSEGYYETFGFSAVECYAAGIPVVASRIGVMNEIVRDGETGLLFNPGDPDDLVAKAQWLWDRPEESRRMGLRARREYEQKYTPERNYQMLIEIYSKAIAEKVR